MELDLLSTGAGCDCEPLDGGDTTQLSDCSCVITPPTEGK